MKLPEDIRERFRRYGRQGGKTRAALLSDADRRAVSSRAAITRWINRRFGSSSFAALGLPGGELVDKGLADLAAGTETPESLLVSLAAPRLRRERVPVGKPLPNANDRLYDLLVQNSGDLAHTRYLAHLSRMESFANACHLALREPDSNAK